MFRIPIQDIMLMVAPCLILIRYTWIEEDRHMDVLFPYSTSVSLQIELFLQVIFTRSCCRNHQDGNHDGGGKSLGGHNPMALRGRLEVCAIIGITGA
jgi:hypothetical protein